MFFNAFTLSWIEGTCEASLFELSTGLIKLKGLISVLLLLLELLLAWCWDCQDEDFWSVLALTRLLIPTLKQLIFLIRTDIEGCSRGLLSPSRSVSFIEVYRRWIVVRYWESPLPAEHPVPRINKSSVSLSSALARLNPYDGYMKPRGVSSRTLYWLSYFEGEDIGDGD